MCVCSFPFSFKRESTGVLFVDEDFVEMKNVGYEIKIFSDLNFNFSEFFVDRKGTNKYTRKILLFFCKRKKQENKFIHKFY